MNDIVIDDDFKMLPEDFCITAPGLNYFKEEAKPIVIKQIDVSDQQLTDSLL